MADRKPLGSSGYASMRHLAPMNNIDPPPAKDINAITGFPDIGHNAPMMTAHFDMSGMKLG
jgi:hypothetical protein